MGIINAREIEKMLETEREPSEKEVEMIVEKAKKAKGLSQEEAAALLNVSEKKSVQKMLKAAREIKESIYGNRIVLFAPLYLSNECSNNCLYCAFRMENKELPRKTLTMQEIRREVSALEAQGHKRLLLVAGEHPAKTGIEYLEEAIQAVYSVKNARGEIRRVNVNAAPMAVEEFERLKNAGIGTYQLFQETYHPKTYAEMHISGPKSDYGWRLTGMDRAQEAGIDDVGIGALFGLHDYRFEVLALLQHAQHMESEFGVGPHTISMPRMEPAMNAPASINPPAPVSDDEFRKLVAVLRLAVPYTGMILSTRESPELRNEIFNYGISQISAGSRTTPGGYSAEKKGKDGQFELHDSRTTSEVVRDLMKAGFVPSFCTACYRKGRTGDDFMALAKPGEIQNFCLPNALLTLKEYLLDYGNDENRKLGSALIGREMKKITDSSIRAQAEARMEELEKGKRDLYF